MYVIIHKGKVVLGPLAWAQKYFTDVLKIRHRVSVNIPGKAPENMPYKLDDETSIHMVAEYRPPLNPMIEYYVGPLWDTSNDVVVARYEVVELPIESAKSNFRNLAASERYTKEISGVKFIIDGTEVTIDTSRGNRDVFVQKYLLMSDTETVRWKFPECWMQLTKQQLGDIVARGSAYVQECFDWELDINRQIDSAETASELMQIEIQTRVEEPRYFGE